MYTFTERNPMVLRGSPYDDDAVDRQATIDIPALSKALEPLGKTFSVAEAVSQPERKPLTPEQRRGIIDQAILVLSDLYVHRYLKHTKHAVDPVTALKQLKRRCDEMTGYEFHIEVMKVFKGLRDIHTGYILPRPYSDMVAFLPFLLGAHTQPVNGSGTNDDNAGPSASPEDADAENSPFARSVIVTGLLANFRHPHFKPGVEILSWNGLPIDVAIRNIGQLEQGSNPFAQVQLGLRLMTVRWFGGSLPPSEYFVTIAYRGKDRIIREIRFPWRVMLDNQHKGRVASVQAMWALKRKYENSNSEDPSVEQRSLVEGTVRDQLFDVAELETDKDIVKEDIDIPGLPPGVFTVDKITQTQGGQTTEFGLLKIENFVCGRKAFRDGFLKILNAIPKTGLVIDIRSNPGGLVSAAESVMQFLTPEHIHPLPFQFLATTLVEDLVKSQKTAALMKLAGWVDKVTPSVDVGNQFSRFGHLTDEVEANEFGQRYYGPVMLLTDAVTYSSGDIFAASFQDHQIGEVIGVDPTTGGGGANMWNHRDCVDMSMPGKELDFLPGGAYSGAKLHYAVRRCTRVGRNYGLPIEEEGVAPDRIYDLTRDDLLRGDVDLMRELARLIRDANAPSYSAEIFVNGAPIDMEALDISLPRNGETADVRIRIELDPVREPTEHVAEVNGMPVSVMGSRDGKADIHFSVSTKETSHIRVDSHEIWQMTGHSRRRFASVRRTIRFENPQTDS